MAVPEGPTARESEDASGRSGMGLPDRDEPLLILAATPIGDVRDASPRLLAEIAAADVIAAEDTRRLRRLCAAAGIQPRARVVSHHDHNEADRVPELLDALRSGQRVLVVTDAGMPSVSDPGYRLAAAAIEAGVPLTCVPGPSAVLTALALSGLPMDRFCFEGFLPRRPGQREKALAALAQERRTMVFFEAPHRLHRTLEAMAVAFGPDRRAAVCRELTKTYEEVVRGPLDALVDWSAGGVRGEITLVVEGAGEPGAEESADAAAEAVARVRAMVEDGARLKDACRDVAATSGMGTRALYAQVLAARDERG